MGYLHKPDKTSQVFTPDGYLRSGDFGRLDKDGHLFITGRIKGKCTNSTLIVIFLRLPNASFKTTLPNSN